MNPLQKQRWAACLARAREIVRAARADAPPGADPQNTFAVTVAAAGVAVAAGSAAYGAVSSSNAQQGALDAAGQAPAIVPYKPADPSAGYDQYNNLVGTQLPGLTSSTATLNSADNKAFQNRLSLTSPTLLPNIAAQGNEVAQYGAAADRLRHASEGEQDLASQYLTGKLPDDVAGYVTRSSAYQALTNGYAGSPSAHANTARNLGLTSLDLQAKGAALQAQADNTQLASNSTMGAANSTLGSNLQYTGAVNPSNITATSLLLSPQQLLARQDSNDAYANGVLNRNNQVGYTNALAQAAANGINPAASGLGAAFGGSNGQKLISGIGSLFNGNGNNGGGGNGAGDYTAQGSNAYDANSANATDQYGNYSSYLDANNYDANGTYLPTGENFGGG